MSHTTLSRRLSAVERLPVHVLAPESWVRYLQRAWPRASSLPQAPSSVILVFGKRKHMVDYSEASHGRQYLATSLPGKKKSHLKPVQELSFNAHLAALVCDSYTFDKYI